MVIGSCHLSVLCPVEYHDGIPCVTMGGYGPGIWECTKVELIGSWLTDDRIHFLHDLVGFDASQAVDPLPGSIDLSGCIDLREVKGDFGGVNSLNLAGCKALETLDISNSQLATLNVSGLTVLKSLKVHDNHSLISLNASGCIALESLDCGYRHGNSVPKSLLWSNRRAEFSRRRCPPFSRRERASQDGVPAFP